MAFVTKDKHFEMCGFVHRVQLVRNITTSGVSQVYWWCSIKQHGITSPVKFIKHELIASVGIDINDLPVKVNYSGTELCAVCQSPNAEYHHFAPRHLFGDEADRWPGSYLCKTHHDQWHETVTPNMHLHRREK